MGVIESMRASSLWRAPTKQHLLVHAVLCAVLVASLLLWPRLAPAGMYTDFSTLPEETHAVLYMSHQCLSHPALLILGIAVLLSIDGMLTERFSRHPRSKAKQWGLFGTTLAWVGAINLLWWAFFLPIFRIGEVVSGR